MQPCGWRGVNLGRHGAEREFTMTDTRKDGGGNSPSEKIPPEKSKAAAAASGRDDDRPHDTSLPLNDGSEAIEEEDAR